MVMKKIFALLSAALALAACNKEMEVPVVVPEEDQPIVVNLAIEREDAFEDVNTRATVKTTWAEGDVVFVFFSGIAAPKYLEMKYKSGEWVATPKNGLTASDLSEATEKKMSAHYLPYGGYIKLVANEYGRFYPDQPYNGAFYYAKPTSYTYDSELHGALSLKVYNPINDYTYVHFDVSGYTDRHAYALYQDNVKAISLNELGYGTTSTYMQLGNPLAGHIDKERGVLTFSGVVDNSVIGKEMDYQFSINDETASVLYTRDAGNHTLSKSTAVGLGDLTSAKWNATEYVYLGIDLNGEKLCWAKKNLGATAEKGEGSYGNYYAFNKASGYGVTGTYGFYTATHDFTEEAYDNDVTGDAASFALGGLWRVPTGQQFDALVNNTDALFENKYTANAGMTLTSKVKGYTDQSIFLPAAGDHQSELYDYGNQGWYRSSSRGLSYDWPCVLVFSSFPQIQTQYIRDCYIGLSIRPVFAVPSLDAGVIDPIVLDHDYVDMGNGLAWATENLGGTPENPLGSVVGWESEDPATKAWGPEWRTPTIEEWQWLLNPENTTSKPGFNADFDYMRGIWFTSKITGNTLFIPLLSSWGESYWSSTRIEGSTNGWFTAHFEYDYGDSCSFSADYSSYGDLSMYLRPVADLNQ